MFGLFRRKPQPKPEPKPRPDDATKSKLAITITDLLTIQLTALPNPVIEDAYGNINRKAIGYIYGYVDAFLTVTGYNMSDFEVGPWVTFHVFRKLFPNLDPNDAQRYVEFLMNHMQDQVVALGMMVGGQEFLDSLGKVQNKDHSPLPDDTVPGLIRFIVEQNAGGSARADRG
jgi:hypothetical protein